MCSLDFYGLLRASFPELIVIFSSSSCASALVPASAIFSMPQYSNVVALLNEKTNSSTNTTNTSDITNTIGNINTDTSGITYVTH